METLKKKVNVAPKSTRGHFVEGAKDVVLLDEVSETSIVEGGSVLKSENHTTLEMNEDCVITIQKVYDPLLKTKRRVVD